MYVLFEGRDCVAFSTLDAVVAGLEVDDVATTLYFVLSENGTVCELRVEGSRRGRHITAIPSAAPPEPADLRMRLLDCLVASGHARNVVADKTLLDLMKLLAETTRLGATTS